MIPLATKTTLSYERCAQLQQKLADLNQAKRDALPEYVKTSLKALEDAQAKLTKHIDVYLHKGKYDPDTEYETIETIIETCPEFLATKDDTYGEIPLNSLMRRFDNCSSAISAPLMVRVGLQYGVGGDDTRGGILVKNKQGWNSLEICTSDEDNIEILNALKAMDPPMFHKADICELNLLQEAVKDSCRGMVEYFVKMDPSAMFHSNEKYGIPLQYCKIEQKDDEETDEDYAENKQKKLAIFKFLLHESMLYRPHDETIGGLFAITHEAIEEGEEPRSTKTILELMISTYGDMKTWGAIYSAISSFENIPIHHKVIKHVPKQWNRVCTLFPWSVLARDDQGRLPIHVALETGTIGWTPKYVPFVMISKLNLNELDPATGWPPFALAASGNSCDLSTIFFLLRMHPELLEPYCVSKN